MVEPAAGESVDALKAGPFVYRKPPRGPIAKQVRA
jgi:hypothetical protein